MLEMQGERGRLSAEGAALFAALGIDPAALERGRRPQCRACLDWSERRSHLAGAAGAALMARALEAGWLRRAGTGRALRITRAGESVFAARFPP